MNKAAVSHRGPYTAKELEEMKSTRRPYKEGMPFGMLVAEVLEPLDRIKKGPSQPTVAPAKRKKGNSSYERRCEVIDNLIKKTSERGADIYPAIRLVAPELDVESGPTNIKEKIMGKILPQALMFNSKKSADRNRLAEWGPGTQGEDGRHIPFIEICRDVIEKRIGRTSSTMTVDQVCALLDQLRLETEEEKRVNVFEEMSCALTPGELTWIVRIILDDVHLGVESAFLSTWHTGADELMNSRSCLRLVCWTLDGAEQEMGTAELGVQVSRCFKPQLASREVRLTDGTLRDLIQKTVDRLGVGEGQPFQVEEKLDGERMQLHVTVDEQNNMEYRWWSRHGVDYTHKYGSNKSEGTLARYISGALALKPAKHDPLASIILDGEMVVWNSVSEVVLPHRLFSPITDHGPSFWPMFRAFDVVQLNGHATTELPLAARHGFLARYVEGVANRLEWHHGTRATTTNEVQEAFVHAMLDGREGLLVKNLDSTYEPGARPRSWMKLKPEYSTQYSSPLDCVLIGRSYGKGQNLGKLTRLLCGIREGGESRRWLSFCGLGSGISNLVRDQINMRTNGKWQDWGDGAAASKHIQLGRGGHETPDQWIVPEESIVISVKAAAISDSNMYAAGTGLLHPRLEQLPAKDPAQALSMTEVEAIEPVRAIRESAAASKKPAGRPAGGSVLTLAVQPSDAAMATPAETDLFANKSFYIGSYCDDLELSKDEMVAMVRRNGGRVFYKSDESDYAVSDKITYLISFRIRHFKDDIIHPRWLVECVKQQQIVDVDEADRVRWDRSPKTKDHDSNDDDDDDDDFFEPVVSTR